MADVGRDRAQHLGGAGGEDEVVPREAQLEPRRELAERAARGAPCAEVEVGRAGRAAGRRGHHLRDLGGLLDLADREPELGGDVVHVVGAGGAAPGRAPLGEGRLGHVDDERGEVGERERRVARARAQDHALLAAREPALHRARGSRFELLDAAERDEAALQRGDQRRLAQQLRVAGRGRVDEHERPAGGCRDDARARRGRPRRAARRSRARAPRRARPRTARGPAGLRRRARPRCAGRAARRRDRRRAGIRRGAARPAPRARRAERTRRPRRCAGRRWRAAGRCGRSMRARPPRRSPRPRAGARRGAGSAAAG